MAHSSSSIKSAKLGNSDNMADIFGEIVCSGLFSGQTAGFLLKKQVAQGLQMIFL